MKVKAIRLLIKQTLVAPFIFWTLTMVANIFNWLFNLQAGRILPKEDFAVLTVFLSLQYLLNVPANALSTTVTRFTTYYSEKGEQQQHFYFFRQYWWLTWALAAFFIVVIILLRNYISSFFGLGDSSLILIFAALVIPLFLFNFEMGTLFGHFAFIWAGVLCVIEGATKFLLLLLVPNNNISPLTISLFSLPFASFVAWLISILVARSFHPLSTIGDVSRGKPELRDTYKFLGSSIFAGIGTVLIFNLDVLLVKHYFPAYEAGVYSTLSLLGKILFFGAGSLIALLMPFTTKSVAKNESGRKPLFVLLGLVLFAGSIIWFSYLLAPHFIVSFLLTKDSLIALPYLARYSLGMLFLVLATCFVTYNLARKNYLPANLLLVFALLQGVMIFYFHSSLNQVVNVVLLNLSALLFVTVVIDAFGLTMGALSNNIVSFIKMLSHQEHSFPLAEKTRILIYNWRDTKHIRSGGAEVYIGELAKRLVRGGHEVTLFTSNDSHCKNDEDVSGIRVIRRGGFITVYFWAALYYLFRFRGKYDIVIDSENGVPFFSPLYVGKPVVLLVHHVHRNVFFESLIPPFSWVASFVEGNLMPLVYQNAFVVSVSKSTAEELYKDIGLSTTSIIQNGVDTEIYTGGEKSAKPLISYVGRLKKYKSIEILLLAFKKILDDFPKSKLVIAGEGDWKKVLEKQAILLRMERKVEFLGYVSEQEKIDLLGKSWVMVQPSFAEGWGITCLEANACQTPVVASRVTGLKDAVSEGESGYLFDYGNALDLYQKLKEIISAPGRRELLGITAREWSKKYSWDLQVKKFEFLISQIISLPLDRSSVWQKEANKQPQIYKKYSIGEEI
ncbi:MAG: glycosyltransferase [bacterium]|nr:glycosyltransferase [bacterium]